jgi:hypothetical protein
VASRNVLQGFALAKEFIEPKQFAAIRVLFIVMPLSNGIAFHRLRFASVTTQKNCACFSVA